MVALVHYEQTVRRRVARPGRRCGQTREEDAASVYRYIGTL
jgi:hypothetical protein